MGRALIRLFIITALFQAGIALAQDEDTYYLGVSAAFLGPNGYDFKHIEDFDIGRGHAVSIGWIAEDIVLEARYLDTNIPMKSSRANNIHLNRVPGGLGPTKYYTRAVTAQLGLISHVRRSMLLKGTVGFSHHESRIERPDKQVSEAGFDLSFGGAVGWQVFDNSFITLEFLFLNELVGTGNIGLMVFF
jgi:hypothetical protein